MTPRKDTEKKEACHVCSKRRAVGVWRAPNGYKLRGCDRPACTDGYTLERLYKEVPDDTR